MYQHKHHNTHGTTHITIIIRQKNDEISAQKSFGFQIKTKTDKCDKTYAGGVVHLEPMCIGHILECNAFVDRTR